MSKVIRITDYTENLLKQYQELLIKIIKKYDFDTEVLFKSDDQLIQSALINVLRSKREQEQSK